MKKILLFSAVASVLLFNACKKDKNNDTETPTVDDRNALIDKIKVSYGTLVKGALPTTTSTAETPTLRTEEDTILAISGRYLLIQPSLMNESEAEVKGYYIQVNGTNSYFKIDFSTTRGLRKATKNHKSLLREGDNADSIIVIKLPENIKSDTISFTYAAYDASNNVSNHVIVYASILTAGNSEDNKIFAGTWKVNRNKFNDEAWQDHYKENTSFIPYHCAEDGTLTYCYDESTSCFNLPASIYSYTKHNLVFTEKNRVDEISNYIVKRFDFDLSNCDNFLYYPEVSEDDNYTSSWSYDKTNKILTFVDDNAGSDNSSYYDYYTLTVEEITANKLVVSSTSDLGDVYFTELVK
jgi:major membrane immunogen (membrane-anchored lipoprotein)